MLALESHATQAVSACEDDDRGLQRIHYIDRCFETDRATWQLLSLQTRLKKARSPQVRAAIARQIQDTVRELAILYTDIPETHYRQGVEFVKQNLTAYSTANQYAERSGNRVTVRRSPNGKPCMSVNGRAID